MFSLLHGSANLRILISRLVILFLVAVAIKFQNADEFPYLHSFFCNWAMLFIYLPIDKRP